MPLTRVTGFGKAGLNKDVQPTLLAPGAWTVLDNIDIENGDVRSAWGDTALATTSPVVPTYTYAYTSFGIAGLLVSDGVDLYSYDDRTTPGSPDWRQVGGTYSGATGGIVTFTTFLGTLVINFSEGNAYSWDPLQSSMAGLPAWLSSYHCKRIVSYRNFLFAIGMYDDNPNEAARHYPIDGDYTVAWSSAAAEGELPQEWRPSTTNLAGFVQLADTTGLLTNAAILRDDLVIYKDDCVYRCYFTGDEFIFNFERVIDDRGCDSQQGVASLSGVHFFSDRGDIRVFDGQNSQSIVIDRIKSLLYPVVDNLSASPVILRAWPDRDEIYVAVIPEGQTVADEVLVYSVDVDSWAVKQQFSTLSMTIVDAAGAATLTGQTEEDRMLFGTPNNGLYLGDKSNTDASGNPKVCTAERTGMVVEDLQQQVTVRAVYPEILGDATVQISIGCLWQVNDPSIRWTAPQSFTPGVDKRINVRITGIPTAVRITSEVDGSWRLGALSYLFSPAGSR